MKNTCRRLLGTVSASAALVAGAAALAPAVAQADSPINTDLCDGAALSQPFLQWGDSNSYKLAPGGDFEGSLSGWTLSGGAQQAPGSESFGVTGAVGASSLALPNGAVAVSPPTCVDAAYPDFRFFARATTPGARVIASVVYATQWGTFTLPVGAVSPGAAWAPTPPMFTGGVLAGAVSGGVAQLQLQFSDFGGDAQVDDVYVDPKGTCC